MQYLCELKSDGQGRLLKKQWYPSGVPMTLKRHCLLQSTRWVGIKLCIIIMGPGIVRVEEYYDDGDETNN